jgi:signal transduction histidine kinase
LSSRFAEREHRRSMGAPPVEGIESQIESIDDGLRGAQASARALVRTLKSMRAALEELRRDLASAKRKGR